MPDTESLVPSPPSASAPSPSVPPRRSIIAIPRPLLLIRLLLLVLLPKPSTKVAPPAPRRSLAVRRALPPPASGSISSASGTTSPSTPAVRLTTPPCRRRSGLRNERQTTRVDEAAASGLPRRRRASALLRTGACSTPPALGNGRPRRTMALVVSPLVPSTLVLTRVPALLGRRRTFLTGVPATLRRRTVLIGVSTVLLLLLRGIPVAALLDIRAAHLGRRRWGCDADGLERRE